MNADSGRQQFRIGRICLGFGWAMVIIGQFSFRQLTIMKTPLLLPPPAPLSLAMKTNLAPIRGLALLLFPAATAAS